MAFTGPYPTIFSGNTDAMVVSRTTFSGGVTNAGTIGAGGLSVSSSTFRNGGILDIGVISGGIRIDGHSRIVASGATAIAVVSTTTFGGGISNAGVISGGLRGVVVSSVSAFAGDISNIGTISARTNGAIYVDSDGTFAGGIVNSGRLLAGSGTAVHIWGVSAFAGGISNSKSATISALDWGIRLSGVGSFGVDSGGGIVNGGTISAQVSAIVTQNVGRFAVISAKKWGVFIDQPYSRFFGGISNSGKIAVAGQAVVVTAANVIDPPTGGAIVNSGTVSAGRTGIVVGLVYGSLAGGISNSGKISTGSKGLVVGLSPSGASVSVANFFGGITVVVPLSTLPDSTTARPPALIVVPEAVPPLSMSSTPPNTVAPIAAPKTSCVPPEIRAPTSTPLRISVPPPKISLAPSIRMPWLIALMLPLSTIAPVMVASEMEMPFFATIAPLLLTKPVKV